MLEKDDLDPAVKKMLDSAVEASQKTDVGNLWEAFRVYGPLIQKVSAGGQGTNTGDRDG